MRVVAMRGCPSHVSWVTKSCTGLKLRYLSCRLLINLVAIDVAKQRAETYIVLTKSVILYQTQIFVQRKNESKVTNGASKVPIIVCCQILFPILFHTAIL